MRIRRYNPSSKVFDVLFPQTITANVLRKEDGGVLESDLLQYDHHLQSKGIHINKAVSSGTYRNLIVTIPGAVLVDKFPLLLTLHCNLECEPTLSFNGSEPAYIVSGDGDNIPGGQAEGTVLFLVWSEPIQKWVLMSSDTFSDVTKVLLPVDTEYVYKAETDGVTTIVIPEFDYKTDKLTVNYGQTILRAGVDYEFIRLQPNTINLINGISIPKGDMIFFTITKYIATAKRGSLKYDLVTNDYQVKITEENTTTIDIPKQAQEAHSFVINYGQTILRNGIDYSFSDDKTQILLTEIVPAVGDVIVFSATEFVESNAELVPNNWGATGNYRYSMNVIHTSYVATEDAITVIPVPGYNYKRDDIWPIIDNHLLIYDVDYTIDEIGQVVLLKTELNHGDEIFFTILQGAMFDVPNFNVIRATGESGQHIILDMSYSVLCNFYTLLVLLKYDLETNPTIKCVDGPAESVCDCYGNPVMVGYKAGSYLWLVYNYDRKCWYSLGHGQVDITSLMPSYLTNNGVANFTGQDGTSGGEYRETVIEHGLGEKPERIDVQPCEPPNIVDGRPAIIGDIWTYADEQYLYVGNSGNATSKFAWTVSSEDSTADLRSYIDQELAKLANRPGKIETRLVAHTVQNDNTTVISSISGYNPLYDKLIVNFGQTVLREGVDYIRYGSGIQLNEIVLNAGDIIQFTILVQEPT